jgi:hypothetical protein
MLVLGWLTVLLGVFTVLWADGAFAKGRPAAWAELQRREAGSFGMPPAMSLLTTNVVEGIQTLLVRLASGKVVQSAVPTLSRTHDHSIKDFSSPDHDNWACLTAYQGRVIATVSFGRWNDDAFPVVLPPNRLKEEFSWTENT